MDIMHEIDIIYFSQSICLRTQQRDRLAKIDVKNDYDYPSWCA